MTKVTPNRRQLLHLAVSALAGLVAGAGCDSAAKHGITKDAGKTGKDSTADGMPRLLQDPHVCRGINTCKNKGKTGTTNECAGQAHCATVAAHDCNGMNDCKGQGGCGEIPGQNECKGKGGCEVPLSDKTWPKARKRFEELMTKAAKKFGDAPTKNS